MIQLISTLRCGSCALREPCGALAHNWPQPGGHLGPLSRECRKTRRDLVAFGVLCVVLVLLSLLLPRL